MNYKTKKVLITIAWVLLAVLIVGLVSAVAYQLNGGDLTTVGERFRELFEITPAE